MIEMLIHALEYAKAGYHVFPCQPKGKTPLTPNGHKNATTDEKTIRKWWAKWPDANIGLALEPSGLLIIDLDRHPGKPDGVKAFQELMKGHADVKKPPRSDTGGNGIHLFYNRPDGNIKGRLDPGIDIKANGYIVLPPSLHPNGKTYRWAEGRSILECKPIDPPEWLLSLILKEETAAEINTSSQFSGEAIGEYPISSGEKIIQRCAFLKHVVENAESLSEPDWYQGIGVLAYTKEASEIVHKVSSAYPGYASEQTDAKINHWKRDGKGPPTCQTIQEKCGSAVCQGCPFNGSIKSPIVLGYPTRLLEESANRVLFPMESLPGVFKDFALSASKALQCPVDYIACSLLAVVSILIGGKRRVQLEPEWIQSANVWLALVGTPSSKKSPALDKAFTVVRTLEKELYAEYQRIRAFHELDIERYKRDLRDWKDSLEDNPPVKPEEPILERLTTSDTTVEALAELLAANPHGIALVCDELSSWMRSMNQYKNGRGADRSHYLSMWSNSQMTIDRKSKPPIIVSSPYLVLIGCIQPDVLLEISNQGMEDGMKERFLFSCPLPNTEPPVRGTEIPPEIHQKLEVCLKWIFNERSSNEPITLSLSEEAQQIFLDARRKWHDIIHSDEFPREMEAYYAKIISYMGRFALIIHEMKRSIGKTENNVLSEATMREARHLADYFLSHAHIALTMVRQTREEQQIEKTVQWIKKKGLTIVTPRDLTTNKVAGCRKASQAKDTLRIMHDYGYGIWNDTKNKLILLND